MANVLLTLSFCVAIVGCGGMTEPELPGGAAPLAPPQAYAFWWRLTESCSGVRGEFGRVRWYVLPAHSRLEIAGREYDGYWFPSRRSIVLTADALMDGALVRHEMLHALVGSGHSREQFVERCDGVVACSGYCALETGGPFAPDAAAPVIAASRLVIGVAVQPDAPSQSPEGGWTAITVTAQNPLATPVWAQLVPIAPDYPFASTFGYIVRCASSCEGGTGDVYASIEGLRFGFNAAASRRRVFDVHLGPGTYSIWGTFNADTAGPIVVTVTR